MTVINLITEIKAPIDRCFDVSRDAELHQLSATGTNERVVAGRSKGLFELNDEVTWEAVHFGVKQRLTVKITAMNKPHSFTDKMLKGAFKSMCHEHSFEERKGVTIMTDVFKYEVPFGFIGGLVDKLVLKSYMTRFLETRNAVLKEYVEKEEHSV